MNWYGNAKHGGLELLSQGRMSDRSPAVPERSGHDIDIHVVDADPTGRNRQLGYRSAVQSMDDDAAVEHALQIGMPGEEGICCSRPFGQIGARDPGVFLEQVQPVGQFMVNFACDQGHRGKLLVAKQLFHVLAQGAAGKKRQRPDADKKYCLGE